MQKSSTHKECDAHYNYRRILLRNFTFSTIMRMSINSIKNLTNEYFVYTEYKIVLENQSCDS